MSQLSSSTCVVHVDRPASARCPDCRRFFCGECITEHDGRLSCATCLDQVFAKASSADSAETHPRASVLRRASPHLVTLIQGVLGLILCWAVYYSLARLLMAIPADFHDGTMWGD